MTDEVRAYGRLCFCIGLAGGAILSFQPISLLIVAVIALALLTQAYVRIYRKA